MSDGYRPKKHYMRGPGPKWRGKTFLVALHVGRGEKAVMLCLGVPLSADADLVAAWADDARTRVFAHVSPGSCALAKIAEASLGHR